jgi:hypothetical protein
MEAFGIVAALIVTAAARLLIPFFATGQHGCRFQTFHGTMRVILAVIAFGGLVWATTGPWSTRSDHPTCHGAQSARTIIPWIMLSSVIAVVLAIWGPAAAPLLRVFGRLFHISSITWS